MQSTNPCHPYKLLTQDLNIPPAKPAAQSAAQAAAWADEESEHDCLCNIAFGESVAADYPADAWVKLGSTPRLSLHDFIANVFGALLVSDRFKQLLAEFILPADVEFLPVRIIDYYDRPAEAVYWRVNLLNPVDCIDVVQSNISHWDIPQWDVHNDSNIVLDHSRIPATRHLFLIKGLMGHYFTSPSLQQAIIDAGISNIGWAEMSQGCW